MRYVLLLFGDESIRYASPPDVMEDYAAFERQTAASGVTVELGEALEDSDRARTLRRTHDGITVSDGPYAELREQIGGFYVIDAPSFDEALAAAKACPRYAGTELRPVWEIPDEYRAEAS